MTSHKVLCSCLIPELQNSLWPSIRRVERASVVPRNALSFQPCVVVPEHIILPLPQHQPVSPIAQPISPLDIQFEGTCIPDTPHFLNRELGLGPAAPGMRAVSVAGELNRFRVGELQDLLEPAADRHEDLLALSLRAALATADIAISAVGNVLSYRTSPNADPVESLPDVDDDTHDLPVVLILQRLANGGEHDVEPKSIDIDAALVLVLIRPLATMLVLGVLPLGADTRLEQVVVRLLSKLGNGDNIVLGEEKG